MKRLLVLLIASFCLFGSLCAQTTSHFGWDQESAPYAYSGNGTYIATVWIDNVLQTATNIEVAAFVGDVCRGAAFIEDSHIELGVYFDEEGETASFKVYDPTSDQEYICNETVLLNENGTMESDDFRLTVTTQEPEEPTAPAWPWVPNTDYSDNFTAFAQIQINGVPVTTINWKVGSFCGEGEDEECRGLTQKLTQGPPTVGIYCMLTIRGNSGDEIHFWLFDTENDQVHPGVCSTRFVLGSDEGQSPYEPLILNFVTEQTFTLDITGYTTDTKDHYYLIASPIGEVSPANVTNMISNQEHEEYHYDLFYFDQDSEMEWINYKPGEGSTDAEFNLIPGKGYLYANSVTTQLVFTGTPISDATYNVTLVKNAPNNPEGGFEGWNLVGNPFGQKAYITKDFYIMNEDGDEIINGTGNSIEVMQGIFVEAEDDGETMTFSKEETPDNNGKLVINMQQARGTLVDRAMVRFNANRRLPKFMLNEDNTKLYIPQEGTDYAVVSATSETEEMPLNFKASENGVYTLSVASENVSFEHLTLIDHLTGAEVNLLATPNYQFNANTNDPAARFTILFRSNSNVSTAEQFNPICYRMDGQLTINGIEGDYELQVIDLLGRVISSTTVNGDFNQMLNAAPGVYSLRVITADKVYSQKIVVE